MILFATKKNRLIMLMMFMGAIFSLVNQSVAQQIVVLGDISTLREGTSEVVRIGYAAPGPAERVVIRSSASTSGVSLSRSPITPQLVERWDVAVRISDNDFVDNPPRTEQLILRSVLSSLTISIAVEDDDVASIDVRPSSLPNLDRGSSTTWAIDLVSAPASSVTLTLSSSDTSKAMLNTPELTFSTTNWNDAQTVVVTPTADGFRSDRYTITITSNELPEHRYVGLINELVPEIQADNLANVAEGSSVGTMVSLSHEPTANVTVTVTSDNGHVTRFAPSALTFTSIDYNVGKRVRVNVADNTFVGDVAYGITLSVTGGASEYIGSELVLAGTIADDATDQANLPTAGIEHNAGNANLLSEIVEGGDTDPAANSLGILEDVGLTSFGVRLSAQPSNLVTLTPTTTSNQIAVSPAELIFDSFNWNSDQMFQIAAGDNAIVGSPDVSYEVTVSVSDGPSRFTGVSALMVTGTIVENDSSNDDDLAGINFAVAQVPALAEDGMTMLGVSLAAEPASDVVVTFSSSFDDSTFSGVAAVSITNDVLTFTSSTWDTQQQVEVGGRDNDLIGPLDYTITASVVSGPSNQNSGGYSAGAGLIATISGVLNDNDGASVSLVTDPAATLGDIGEGVVAPASGSFSVSLSHRPVSNVVVSVIYSDSSLTGIASASLTSLLTFTTNNWDTAQDVNFQAGEDSDADDNDYTITLDVISGPGGYGTLANKELTGTIIDNDAPSAPGFTISNIGNIAEGYAAGQNLEVVLDLAPTADVELTVHTADIQLRLDKATLTFTTTDWNMTQTVNVVGVDDDYVTGEVYYVSVPVNVTVTVGVRAGPDIYTGLDNQTRVVRFLDTDAAAIVVAPTSTVPDLSAGGSSTDVQVRLASLPGPGDPGGNNVVLTVTSSDPTAATVAPSLLTFTSINATLNQTVAVSPVDDSTAAGNQDYIITIAVVDAFSHNAFDDINDKTLTGTVVDDDTGIISDNDAPSFTISNIGNIAEGYAAGQNLEVVLDLAPTADVELTVHTTNIQLRLDKATLTFTTTDWNITQTVNVVGVDDDFVTGSANMTVTVGVRAGPDIYTGLANQTRVVRFLDTDAAAIVVAPASTVPNLSEGGSSTDVQVRLASVPFPIVIGDRHVVLTITSSDPTAATVAPSLLTFTSVNATLDQAVAVSPVDDSTADGNQDYIITIAVVDDSSNDAFDDINDKTLKGTVVDDDIAVSLVTFPSGTMPMLGQINEGEASPVSGYFSVSLSHRPASNVVVSVIYSDSSLTGIAGAPLTSLLTFTTHTWDTATDVAFEAGEDSDADDNDYTITLDVINGPGGYGTLANKELTGTIIDNDAPAAPAAPGFTISNIGNIAEGYAEGQNLEVVLDLAPTSDVELTVHTDNIQLSLDKATLTFTTTDWNITQTVNVVGVDDDYVRGSFYVTVTVGVRAGSDIYTGLANQTRVVRFLDTDAAAIVVAPASTVPNLSEGGSSTDVQVRLSAVPFPIAFSDNHIVLTITSSDPTAATVVPSLLTFTRVNATLDQAVAVSPVDDSTADGNQDYIITIAVVDAVSHNSFDDINDKTLTGTVVDDDGTIIDIDAPSFTISNIGNIAEGYAAGQNLEVVLDLAPTADVELTVHTADIQLSLDKATLTFTTTDWNMTQTVNVVGVDDDYVTGEVYYVTVPVYVTVTVGVRAGSDIYTGLANQTRVVRFLDTDAAAIVVAPASTVPNLSEGGSSTDVQVRLASLPGPGDPGGNNVVLTVTSSDPTAATVAPSLLTFTSINATLNQTVTVSPVDDSTADRNQDYIITIAVVDAVSHNSFDRIHNKTLTGTVVDDDGTIIDIDAPGFTISNIGNIAEDYAEGQNLEVVLDLAPTADVELTVHTADIQLRLDKATLTFTTTDWNMTQTVNVVGVDDDYVMGAVYDVTVTVGVRAGSDIYTGLANQTRVVKFLDTDAAAIVVAPASTVPDLSEGGSSTDVQVRLVSLPGPGDPGGNNVVLTVTSSDPTAATVAPSLLTFTSINATLNQIVAVSPVDGSTAAGNQDYIITIAVVDAASHNSFDGIHNKILKGTVVDDDGTISDNDVPGFTISNIGNIAEGYAAGQNLEVVLDLAPTADVELTVHTADTLLRLDKATLTFTTTDWNITQTVNVVGVDDDYVTEAIRVTVTVGVRAGSNIYTGLANQTMIVRFLDTDATAIIVDPASTVPDLSESGSSNTSTDVQVRLASVPFPIVSGDMHVVLTITSSDPTAAMVAPSLLTFTHINATLNQTVAVSPVDDSIADSNQDYIITIAVVDDSSHVTFDDVNDKTLTGTVVDDDAIFILAPAGGAATLAALAEGENTTTFTVVLGAQPFNNVVFDVIETSANISLSRNSLTFLPDAWDVAQTVTVTSRMDNNNIEDDANYTVTVSINDGSSNDAFDLLPDQTLNGMVTDDDVAGFTLAPAGSASTLAALAEGESTTTFTVVLDKRPPTNVVFDISTTSSDISLSDTSLTFEPSVWDAAQTVTVTSRVDNTDLDGNADYTVTVSVSAGTPFDTLPEQTLNGMVTDDDVAGFTLALAGSASTLAALAEGENTTTFTVVLGSRPSSNVVFDISTTSSDINLSDTSLTFEPSAWDAAQTVTVTSRIDNNITDGNAAYIVTVRINDSSSDDDFDGLDEQTLNGMVTDDDVAGFTLAPAGSASTLAALAEGESTTTFTVVLDKRPPTNVVFDISTTSSDINLSDTSLTFEPDAWDAAQTVTVTSRVDNNNIEDDANYTVTVSVNDGSSNDAFDLLPDQTLNGMVTDDDVAGFTLAPAGGGSTLAALAEGESTTIFTVVLDKRPPTNVVFDISTTSSDINLSDTSLTFEPDAWDAAQTVTVTSRADNNDLDGNADYTITVSVNDGSSNDAFDLLPDQTLNGMVTDDDVADFTLAPAGGGSTLAALAEGESTTTFTVVLDKRPPTNVVFDISTTSSDISLSDTSLTFEPSAWDAAQTVTVTSRVDNNNIEDDANYMVTVSINDGSSNDAFDLLPDQTLNGMVTDDDVASFTLTPAGSASTLAALAEGENTTTFPVVLGARPISNVVFDVSTTSSDISLSDARLTFQPSAWNTAQTVTVTSRADNNDLDGNAAYIVTVSVNDGSSDDAFDPLLDQTLNGMVTDDDVAGFTLNPLNGSSLSNLAEGSNTLTFTVVLEARPFNNVVFDVSTTSSDISLSDTSLTFEPSAWDAAQTVTVTSRMDNDDLDGNAAYTVMVSVNAASDDAFDRLPAQMLNGMVTDNDVAGFTLVPAGSAATLAAIDETGSTIFTARLNRAPATNVTLSITSTDTDEATVSKATLVFSNTTWNAVQTVSVSSVADRVTDGPQNYMINVVVATGSDANYLRDVAAQQLSGQVTDADVASFTLTPLGGATTLAALAEGRATTTFTVVLGAQPLSNVVFDVIEMSADVSLSDTSLTFEPDAWDAAQTVTVTSRVDNDNLEDDANYIVTVRVNDGSSDDAFDDLGNQTLNGIVTDNDTASFTLNPSDGSTLPKLVEGESTTTFTVALNKRPQNNVVFDVITTSSDISLSPSSLTFEPDAWNTAQTVTVTSRADNNDLDGNAAYTVTVSVNAGTPFDSLPDQTLTGMVTDDDEAFTISKLTLAITEGDADGDEFAIALTTQPTGDVILSVSSSDTSIAIIPADQMEMTFTNGNWNSTQTVTVTTSIPDDDEPGDDQPFTITISVVPASADPNYVRAAPATLTGLVVDNDGLGAEETTQVKTAIAVADSFGSAQVATDLITARLQQPPVLQPAAQIGGTNLVSTAAATQPFKEPDVDPWQDDKESVWSGDFEELLPGTNFVLPLSDTTVSGAHTELWGSVGYTDVKGDPTIDNVTIDYDGQATGVHVGIGRQYTNGTNFGVSIGSTKVKIDISGTKVAKIERDLVSIHPYIGWSLSDRASAWLIAGYGDGDYILELENDKIETKASLRMLGGGLQRNGMLGTFDTAVRLEGVVTRSEIEGVADKNLASDAGSAWLLRTELEIGRTYTSQGGSLIQPFGAVSYRFDGGDLGSSGAGEISLGLRSQFDDAWLADFKARLQVTEADHENHGVQGYLKYDHSNDRRGLLFSAAHSVEYDNQDDVAERTDLFASELGYGWGLALFSQRGILDIHLRNEYGDESSSLSLGIGYTTPSLQLGLDGSADEVTAYLNYVINY